MIHERYDAIVAGAGPAGSRAARELARGGLTVALLEENREVGTPCHCSGLVSPRTLRLAGVDDTIVRNVIRGAVIHLPGGAPMRLGGDRTHAVVIDRVDLDRRLARQAVDAGARLIPAARLLAFRLVGGERRGSGEVVATVRREGRSTELRAQILIGADGAHSRVAEQLRGVHPRGYVSGIGGSATYHVNPHPDHVEVFVDGQSAPGWFGWTIPLEPGVARIGTGSANGIKPLESLRRLRERFPETFGRAELTTRSGGTIALWQPGPLVSNRVMLVGDAARQVKPTSGGGIHAALHAAGLAAHAALRAFAGGDLSTASLRAYEQQWEATLGREFRRQHDIRRGFLRLGEEELRRLIETLRRPGLRLQVETRADIDFPSGVVWALFRADPLLALRLAVAPQFPGAWLSRATTAFSQR